MDLAGRSRPRLGGGLLASCGAAINGSPRRQPWVGMGNATSPVRGDRNDPLIFFRHSAAPFAVNDSPTARAVVYPRPLLRSGRKRAHSTFRNPSRMKNQESVQELSHLRHLRLASVEA